MGKKEYTRKQIDKAREAYEIAFNPDITCIYNLAIRYGVDPDQCKTSDVPNLTRIREFLRDLQIDFRSIIQRHYDDIALKHSKARAQRLIDWLKPDDGEGYGNMRRMSYWQRKELIADRRRLESIIRSYRHQ